MNERKTLVPKLRFPEFRGEAGWDTRPLISVCQHITQGGTPDTSNPDYWNGDINWLTPAEMGKAETSCIGSTVRTITDLGLRNCSSELLPVSSVIISTRAPIGHLAINSAPMAINQGCKGLIPGPSLNYSFLFSSLLRAKPRLVDLGAGNTFKELSGSALKSFSISVPTLPEQQKIADCLSSLDELIAAQGRKIEALKTYKRGLMQQLFPREGETLPRLRFPEFRDAPEWKEVKAGTLFANRTKRGDDSLPIYSVTMTDGLVKRSSLDRRIDDLAEATGNKKVFRHDIAYNMMRMWQGACGLASEDCMVSPAYVVLSPQSNVHSQFYGYLFKLPQMLRLFTSHSRGLTEDRLRLYYADFSSIAIPQPDEKEQKRIAGFLMALDTRIITESRALTVLQSHKNGLMQLLFPSLEEVEA